ncbi:MAG: ankyrin repeat domain-containing protein [Candidatus Aminicenantaceae bacterium]
MRLEEGNIRKTVFIVLLAILAVTFLTALSQEIEEHGKKWINAIMFGKIDEVNKLIQAGVDVNKQFDLGASRDITPLYFAVLMGNADIGKLLINAGANVDINFEGVNLLHIAGLYAGNKAVTELLIAKGLDVNAKSMASGETKDATPLHAAAGKGNIEVVEVLIRNGAELEARLSQNQNTPLHLAVRNSQKATVTLLIDEGADVNAKTRYGETPLDLGISKGHDEIVDLLRKHGGILGKKQN